MPNLGNQGARVLAEHDPIHPRNGGCILDAHEAPRSIRLGWTLKGKGMLVRTCEADSGEAADMSSWLTFRISLEKRCSELLNELRQFPPPTSNEALDFPSVARRRFLERKVEEINEALARIVDGTYGACVACGMAIPIATLIGIPAARHCEACVAAHRADRLRQRL